MIRFEFFSIDKVIPSMSDMSEMKRVVAAVQCDVAFCDLQRNADAVIRTMAELNERQVDLGVFPECMLSGYCFESRQEAWGQSVTIDDPVFERFAAACSGGRLHVVVGFLLRENEQLFNAQALIGRAGVLGVYRKVHLPGLGVDRFVDRGTRDFEVIDVAGMRVGLAICYDSSFPETARVLSLLGADVIALSTNWPVAALRTAQVVPAARAMENHVYFVAANRIGTEREFAFCGTSSIAGPDGVMLAETATSEKTVLLTSVDLAIARNKQIVRTPGKHVIDRIADRQPERYQIIAQTKKR